MQSLGENKNSERSLNEKYERRAFERFPIEFMIELSAEDSMGNAYMDKAVLQDISGGGVKFIVRNADKYFSGQFLKITIYLPGTDEIKAFMSGKATVIRVCTSISLEIGEKRQGVGIAVKLDEALHFERPNVKA